MVEHPVGIELEKWCWKTSYVWYQDEKKTSLINAPKIIIESQVWWLMPVIPTLGRLRKGNHEFKTILGCILNSRKA
jgi:hypothetical protein